MGTNYYAFIKPKRSEEEQVISAINMQQYDKVTELIDKFYNNRKYHLGKKSGGWQFLWNPNREVMFDYDRDGYYLSDDYIYEFNRKSIEEFLQRDDVIISDEYGRELTFEEFAKIAFDNKGRNIETSRDWGNNENKYVFYKAYEHQLYNSLGFRYSVYGSEFYNDEDKLRFSTSTDFC